jgi:hypothetical protein
VIIKKLIGIGVYLEWVIKMNDEFYYKVYPRKEDEKLGEGEFILMCTPLNFYTKNDEDEMFRWVKKIKCVIKYYGVSRSLHLVVQSNKVKNKDLLELIGLFRRYNFDLKQLKIFMNADNKIIFQSLANL